MRALELYLLDTEDHLSKSLVCSFFSSALLPRDAPGSSTGQHRQANLTMTNRGGKAKIDLSRLVADLKQGPQEMRARAAKQLLTVASSDSADGEDSGAARVVRAGAVAPLAALIPAGTDLGQMHSAATLATIAAAGFSADVAEAGTIKQTVNLMRTSAGQQVQAAAVSLLANISTARPHRRAIVAAGAVAPLVRILKQGSMDARIQAALAMANLADGNAEAQSMLVAGGALPLLIASLPSGKAQMAAARALGALCSADAEDDEDEGGGGGESSGSAEGGTIPTEIQMAILRHGGVPPLLALLDGVNVNAQVEAARAVARLARENTETQCAIAKAGGLGPLLALLPSRTVAAQARGAEALAMLARHHRENQESIARLGGVPTLVGLLAPMNDVEVCHTLTL